MTTPVPAAALLARIERIGNRLPEPATLFVVGTLLVIAASAVASAAQWQVTRPDGTVVHARSLADGEGLWWLTSHLVENFVRFPPLGIVLVGMLGIGLAERSGLIAALVAAVLRRLAAWLLPPAVVFAGIISSLGLDAGYVVLPPLAAMLYRAAGRSPLAGIAAAFAGVSAGFSANLAITAVDPLLVGFTQAAAALVAPDYQVAVTANWWFMIASTVLLTGLGWWVSVRWVEPRLGAPPPPPDDDAGDTPDDARRGLAWALWTAAGLAVLTVVAAAIPGAPLHGQGARFSRLVEATVPLIFVGFLLPGLAYGIRARTIRSDRDVARMMGETLAALGPYIVLAFFAAQFIAAFGHSGLGTLLAITGGQWLAAAALPHWLLMLAFVLLAMAANLLIGSASAKYALLAPVFVPMFMAAGVAPELTQAAYRIGDSVTNVVTPLNPYMVVVLAELRRHAPDAGFGTLLALMLPYAVAFGVGWVALLLAWIALGVPLGPGGPLTWP